MKAKDIINILENFAEPRLIDSWDNTGFQIGDEDIEVERVLVALDLDDSVLDRAIKGGYQMIITHHPIIFRPLKSITNKSYTGRLILKLIKHNIVAFNAHSNLDVAKSGVNEELANILGLKDTKPIKIIPEHSDIGVYGYGRVGYIKEIDAIEFIHNLKEKLEANELKIYGNINKKIKNVAVCGGSGGEFIYDAYQNHADIYITGDIKYHEAQYALQLGLIIIDAGHYQTEKVILPIIKQVLEKESKGSLHIMVDEEVSVPYQII